MRTDVGRFMYDTLYSAGKRITKEELGEIYKENEKPYAPSHFKEFQKSLERELNKLADKLAAKGVDCSPYIGE